MPPSPPPGSPNAVSRDTGAVADDVFRAFATSMLRTFVLAGTGASSSAICYVLHLLATHPAALARVRAEHDAVFGRHLAHLPQLLATEPHRLGALPYTDAVIKESLRLYAPATSSRQGAPAPDGLLCVDDDDDDDDDHNANANANTNNNNDNDNVNVNGKDNAKGVAAALAATAAAAATAAGAADRRPHRGRVRCYPTDGMNVWLLHAPMHRAPAN
jgi:hypothetical protein